MGMVYRARHVDSGEAAALKTVRVSSAGLLASLRREVFTLRSLQHPQIVRVIDSGVDVGRRWYAMQMCKGRSLGSFLYQSFSPSADFETNDQSELTMTRHGSQDADPPTVLQPHSLS